MCPPSQEVRDTFSWFPEDLKCKIPLLQEQHSTSTLQKTFESAGYDNGAKTLITNRNTLFQSDLKMKNKQHGLPGYTGFFGASNFPQNHNFIHCFSCTSSFMRYASQKTNPVHLFFTAYMYSSVDVSGIQIFDQIFSGICFIILKEYGIFLRNFGKRNIPQLNHEQQHETTKHFKLIAFS